MIITEEQDRIIKNAIKAYKSMSTQLYQYSGRAGTGKSTVMLMIIEALGVSLDRVAAMAFIGQAAIIMRTKGLMNAKTIHSWLFEPKKVVRKEEGKIVKDSYYNSPIYDIEFIDKQLFGIDLIFVDEGYSVPRWLRPHIEKHGIKIIATGDRCQLPPVGDQPAFLYEEGIDELTIPMRQSGAIYHIANRAMLGLPIHKGHYGNALVIDYNELTNDMLYYADMVITGTNATRDLINKKIRHELLRIDSDLPVLGEKVICRNNNWTVAVDGINLANGLRGIVTNMPGVHGFDGTNFNMSFKPDMFSKSFRNLSCDYNYFIANNDQRKALKVSKFNKGGEKFESGYCLTTHLSQGSQARYVVYIEEYLNPMIQNQLNYVGASRPTDFLIYVKKPKKFF